MIARVAPASRVSRVTVRWGRTWPPVITPNVHPKPRPVRTVRSLRYVVQVHAGGRWRTVARVRGHRGRVVDAVRFPAVRAGGVRLRLLAGSGVKTIKTSSTPPTPILPMVQELSVG